MDQISRLRFRNTLDSLLAFCDNAKSGKEKSVLLRLGVVSLNKLRIHVDADPMLGHDVRDLNAQIVSCTDGAQIVELMWDETTELLRSYRLSLD
jgi:hypothetical protein